MMAKSKNAANAKSRRIVRQALAAAKELKKIPLPSDRELAALHKEGLHHVKELQKLLRSAWFIEDTDRQGRKLKKK